MPVATWEHGGSPLYTAFGVAPFTGVASNQTELAGPCATWNGTGDENGDTGTVLCTTDDINTSAISVITQLFDDGSIDHGDACNTIRVVFDYAVTNGPMGTATAGSEIAPLGSNPPVTLGPGVSTGTYDQSISGVDNGTPTMGDVFTFLAIDNPFFAGIGLSMSLNYTGGVFSNHNRRLAVSNFQVIIDYGASSPVVTDVSPSHGDKAGGTVVTLTGTDLDTGANAFFNGTPASGYVAASPTSATCVSPAHAAGEVTVTVV